MTDKKAYMKGWNRRHREERKIYMQTYNREHKQDKRNSNLRRDHGITLADYNKLFAEQQGLCLGCKRHQSQFKQSLVVDHSHQTGELRGLLCNQCNTALGLVKDNTETLFRLAEYIQKKEAPGNS